MSYLGFAPAIVHRINAAGANITVVAGVNANGSALIVRNGNTINNISDLFGKKIAIPAPNNMQDFMLRMIVNSDPSVSYENITTVVMSVSNMPIALKSGSIDGYIAWEPYCAQSVAGDSPSGKYLVNSSAIWPNHPCCVIASYNSFLKAHPDIVKKVLDVHIKATKFINDPANRDEVVQIAVNRLGISPEIAQFAISNVGYIYEPDKEKMVEFLDKLVTFNTVTFPSQYTPEGMTNRTEFINYFVNTTILDTILAESA
ncbi:MAG: ABC transporter substrate-binding protein, partial [Promethearchaeota archaeon]